MATVSAQEQRFNAQSMIFRQNDRPLAESLHERLQQQRSYLLDSVKFSQPAPHDTQTLVAWSQSEAFASLSSATAIISIAIILMRFVKQSRCSLCGRNGILACCCPR